MSQFLNYFKRFSRNRKILKPNYLNTFPNFFVQVIFFVWGVVKILLIYNFFVSPLIFNISMAGTGSMIPTGSTNDIVLVNTSAYGVNLRSFIINNKPKPFLDYWFLRYRNPERCEFVTFFSKYDNNIPYSKRIVGIPHDKIQMINGVLFINKQPMPLKYKGLLKINKNNVDIEGFVFEEDIFGFKHDVLYFVKPGDTCGHQYFNTQEFVVPEDHVFMLGDNRLDSEDSRGSLGFIPIKNIFGKNIIRILDYGNIRQIDFSFFSRLITQVNFSDIGKWIF